MIFFNILGATYRSQRNMSSCFTQWIFSVSSVLRFSRSAGFGNLHWCDCYLLWQTLLGLALFLVLHHRLGCHYFGLCSRFELYLFLILGVMFNVSESQATCFFIILLNILLLFIIFLISNKTRASVWGFCQISNLMIKWQKGIVWTHLGGLSSFLAFPTLVTITHGYSVLLMSFHCLRAIVFKKVF